MPPEKLCSLRSSWEHRSDPRAEPGSGGPPCLPGSLRSARLSSQLSGDVRKGLTTLLCERKGWFRDGTQW